MQRFMKKFKLFFTALTITHVPYYYNFVFLSLAMASLVQFLPSFVVSVNFTLSSDEDHRILKDRNRSGAAHFYMKMLIN